MIPLVDVIPPRSLPYVTWTLILSWLVLWLVALVEPPAARIGTLYTFGLVPDDLRRSALVTAPWVHASWLHVLSNAWGLWIFGENVEDRLGHARYVVFVLLTALVAPVVVATIVPTVSLPVVGASGIVAATAGAHAATYPGSRVLTLAGVPGAWDLVEVPASGVMVTWLIVQFVGAGAVAPTLHTHDPALACASYVAAFLVGGVYAVAAGARKTPRGWW